MADTTLTQAIKEAYASAPAGVVTYHTLELNHPAFTAPIRVVRDYQNLTARLETTAPRDAGTLVTFAAFAFDFTKPEISATGIPTIQIEMDNADRSIVANIEQAMTSSDMISVIYREFISTDLSAPQNNPPLSMSIITISADVFRVHATAGFPMLTNVRFPTQEYDSTTFPGLAS